MSFSLGMNAKAYVSSTPIASTTSATVATAIAAASLMNNIKDLKQNLATDKADISTRGGGGWKQTLATLKDGTITFTSVWQPGDATFTIIQNAWTNATEVFFAALDGPVATSGNQGLAGNFTITNFSRNESLTDALAVDVELSPSSWNAWFTKA